MLYLGSAAATALILFFARDVDAFAAPSSWSAILQVLWVTVLMFFLPSVMLGTPTPMIVKLSLSSLDATGRVVGRIQAAATAGSILGVFLTGFALISWFGTRAIVAGVVVLLLLLAALSHPYLTDTSRVVGRRSGASPRSRSCRPSCSSRRSRSSISAESKCIKESNYYCIDVGPDQHRSVSELRLDLLIHGIVNPQNPAELIYPYEKLYQQVTETAFPKGKAHQRLPDRRRRVLVPALPGSQLRRPHPGRRDRPGGHEGRALAPRAARLARDRDPARGRAAGAERAAGRRALRPRARATRSTTSRCRTT